MKAGELIDILPDSAKAIVLYGEEQIALAYIARIKREGLYKQIANSKVKSMKIGCELRHKRWKELGLQGPLDENMQADYDYKDLKQTIYYVIQLEVEDEDSISSNDSDIGNNSTACGSSNVDVN